MRCQRLHIEPLAEDLAVGEDIEELLEVVDVARLELQRETRSGTSLASVSSMAVKPSRLLRESSGFLRTYSTALASDVLLREFGFLFQEHRGTVAEPPNQGASASPSTYFAITPFSSTREMPFSRPAVPFERVDRVDLATGQRRHVLADRQFSDGGVRDAVLLEDDLRERHVLDAGTAGDALAGEFADRLDGRFLGHQELVEQLAVARVAADDLQQPRARDLGERQRRARGAVGTALDAAGVIASATCWALANFAPSTCSPASLKMPFSRPTYNGRPLAIGQKPMRILSSAWALRVRPASAGKARPA